MTLTDADRAQMQRDFEALIRHTVLDPLPPGAMDERTIHTGQGSFTPREFEARYGQSRKPRPAGSFPPIPLPKP